jgi:hypothetical protein
LYFISWVVATRKSGTYGKINTSKHKPGIDGPACKKLSVLPFAFLELEWLIASGMSLPFARLKKIRFLSEDGLWVSVCA